MGYEVTAIEVTSEYQSGPSPRVVTARPGVMPEKAIR